MTPSADASRQRTHRLIGLDYSPISFVCIQPMKRCSMEAQIFTSVHSPLVISDLPMFPVRS